MPSTAVAYAALREAMRDTVPSCLGDGRFTSETADPEPLAIICARCPLFAPCHTLAISSDRGPVWGVVGGLVRRRGNSMLGTGPRKKLDGIYGCRPVF